MNNIRATKKLNEVELENALRSGATGASWHDEYKDSAYIFVGGLPNELTEGDVITIFSQFGEIMDINMPREKDSGKRKGFGFLMYEDQRSTVLAVDNLNGADVLGRTIRVDHVKEYKQKRERTEEGEWKDAEEQSLNAAPSLVAAQGDGGGRGPGGGDESADESDEDEVDQEDPMAAYFAQRRKEDKSKGKGKEREHGSDRAAEKEAKRLRKEERARKRARKEVKSRDRGAVEGVKDEGERGQSRDAERHPESRSGHSHSHSHGHRRDRDEGHSSRREDDLHSRHRSRSRSPPRDEGRSSRREDDRHSRHRSRSRSPRRRHDR